MTSLEDFCRTYMKDPDEALASLSDLDDEEAAALLIDAGGELSDKSLLDQGISDFEKLQKANAETICRSYCIANGRHLRASIQARLSSPTDDCVLDDLFLARLEHGKVLSDPNAPSELRSQSATNIGNVLIEAGRWVEALDFFQKAQRSWPQNGVSALREMQCLMGFHNAASDNYDRFGKYGDLDEIYQRIAALSDVVRNTYQQIYQIAGEKAVEQAKHAVSQINTQGSESKRKRHGAYFDFVHGKDLPLALACSPKQYESGKIDTLAFQRVSDDNWQSTRVPEIFAMLNVMKSDYALARQIFFEAQFDDSTTIFHETGSSGDTLDYALYGVQVSAMCSAQRIAYDILDKIAVSLAGYLNMRGAKRTTFDSFWYEYEGIKKVGLNQTVKNALSSGNRGLLALYDLHRDTTKETPDQEGFLRATKEFRNSSTHRFTVLHDEEMGIDGASGILVDHEHVTRFQDLTLSSIRLARASLFYFCDAINSAEDCKPKDPNAVVLTHTVPDHDYIRGQDSRIL